jgi:hypothetical protein
MGYSVYYNGEIDISPELSDEHATLLDEALTKSNPALLGITAEEGQGLYHGCDWQLSGGRLSVEGESRGEQDEWLRLLNVRFFQPNGYTLSGEVSWEGDQSGDTGVIHVNDNRVESVNDSITNRGAELASTTSRAESGGTGQGGTHRASALGERRLGRADSTPCSCT